MAPGRIEVLGKHVDYAGGRSLLCAVDRAMVMVVRPRTDRRLVLRDAVRRESVVVSLDNPKRGPVPWSVYPATVVNRLQRNFGPLSSGVDIAVASNLPSAAGVSSSSALTVGISLVLIALSELASTSKWQREIRDRLSLAAYIGAVENGMSYRSLAGERGVGTMGGAQDQTAILCCSPGQLDVFRWMPVLHEKSIAWPRDHTFVVAVSGVAAAKIGAARQRYNRVARTARHIVAAWNQQNGGTAGSLREVFEAVWNAGAERSTLRAASGISNGISNGISKDITDAAVQGAPHGVANAVPQELRDLARNAADSEFSQAQLEARLEQFFAETWQLIPNAATALASGDIARFGTLTDASQAAAERGLENQVPETVALQRMARELGAQAASAFGAGFGGSVWAMVPGEESAGFLSLWKERYARQFPNISGRSRFFAAAPSVPAFEVSD